MQTLTSWESNKGVDDILGVTMALAPLMGLPPRDPQWV